MEDRACPVISSKYLSKPSKHHTDAFSRTNKTLRQSVEYQSIFSGNFLPLGVLILLFLFVKKWKSYSGWLWWKQLTCSRLCLRQWLLFTRNEHTSGNTLRQKIHAAEKEQEIYTRAPNHWDVTQTKLKIKPIKVEKIWKWILSLRVLVAYSDISDSKQPERTHQKEMGKVQEYIRHIRQKKCVS